MKRIINIFFILTLFFLLQVSCSEEWLEPKPLSFYAPENVYNEKAGFKSLLVQLRKDLRRENTGPASTGNFLVLEQSASDVAVPATALDFYKLTPNTSRNFSFLRLIDHVYETTKSANTVISRIDDIEWENEEERNAILAEAYFFRSYWYYRLVHTYGDVPFVGVELSGAKLDFRTHSREAILQKIQADMEYAVEWLPATAAPGEVSKGAGHHLLTKIYLANLEFDKAIAAATSVINGPYALMQTRFGSWAGVTNRNVIWDLHRPDNMNLPANTETILATVDRYEAPPEAKTTGLLTMRHYHGGWFNIKDSQGKAGMVASGVMYDTLGRGNVNGRLTPFFQYNIWNYGTTTWRDTPDLRRSDANWIDWKMDEIRFNNPKSVNFGEPIRLEYFASLTDTLYYIYAFPYYKTYAPNQPGERPYGGNGDWYLFRLAETYLLRAEAHYWKNDFASAANDINVVRERANAVPITAAEATIEFIFDERARELFAEEPRHAEMVRVSFTMAKKGLNGYSLETFHEKNWWYDIVKKNNIFYTTRVSLVGNTSDIAPFHVLWPIPQSMITENTLGTINQNRGYVGAENNIPPLTAIE